MQDTNRILRGFFLARHQNRLSRATISNADFYHLIKGSLSYIEFLWKADKTPLQNRRYRSLFYSGTGKKEVMVIVSQICGQISQVTPSFFGYVSLFTSNQSQFFLSPVKRELKSEIESSKLILWSARNRRLTMLWYKLNLINSTCKLLCYDVDKFPVSM